MTAGESSPADLAVRYAELGERLAAHERPDDVLQALCEITVEQIPAAEFAGVTRGQNTGRGFVTVAATDPTVHKVDSIQYELGHGPCVDAIVDSTVFNVADLRQERKWPEFGRRAFGSTGITSMLSMRLFLEHDDAVIAGLNMYATKPNAFDQIDEALGVLLTTHGALAVAAAAHRDRADHLEKALHNSRRIGIALGILMHQHKITEDQAFDLLRIASQHTHRKLADIAEQVGQSGILELPPPRRPTAPAT